MSKRTEFQELLEFTLGSSNVYFQPGPNITLKYDCIVYKRDFARTIHADNKTYLFEKRYMVTLIATHPDSAVVDKLAQLPKSLFMRNYVANGLNHDVFNIYF